MDARARDALAASFGTIACEAGALILSLRTPAIGVSRKPDGSPVCRADVEAEALILTRLAALLPGVSVIAEESFAQSRDGTVPERFLLVDPLDGTREFLAGHDEFTVNIALIERGAPVVGAICVPALHEVYVAGARAFWSDMRPSLATDAMKAIATAPLPPKPRALASRSHLDPQTEHWLSERGIKELLQRGSSFKFCLIARGDADVYPRLAPTMEWDTAAGHAILEAAGGSVLALDGSPLRYGKKDAGFKNAGFIAWGRAPR
jgi:3'(2'), 5'-bisphosphate nucleotidase